MPELFLLAAMMVFTIVLMIGMSFVFKGWFEARDKLMPPDDD